MPAGSTQTNSNISWLKPDQVESMRDAAHSGRHGLRDEALVTVLYDTGLRRAELTAVNRDMLDLTEGELRIPASIQKDYPNENTPSPATFELDRGGVSVQFGHFRRTSMSVRVPHRHCSSHRKQTG